MMKVSEHVIDNQHQYDQVFPLVLMPNNDTEDLNQSIDWVFDNEKELISKLNYHGVLLFRGFPIKTDRDFDSFIGAFDLQNFTYTESLSNAIRRNRTERVFTANEAPASVPIFLHHEMAQTPVFPHKLFFFCEHAAQSGGATPLCRSDILLERLVIERPTFVKSCEEKGLRYSNVMPASNDESSGQGRSWQSTLTATTVKEAEDRLTSLNYQWHWLGDGSLKVTTPVLPAIKELDNGKRVFFNQLIAAHRGWEDARNQAEKSVCFGDGSDFNSKDMNSLIRISDQLTFDLNWQTGDVALVDNFLVMHGRKPYIGERRVLASLII